MSESPIFMGTWKLGDAEPYPMFHFVKTEFDLTQQRYISSDVDLSSFTNVKFCARHESNTNDIDDHTNDDIYENVVIDGGGHCHFEFESTDLVKLGKWEVIMEFEKPSGDKYHSRDRWYLDVVHKMEYGRKVTNI